MFDSHTALIPQPGRVEKVRKAIIFNIISGWRRECVSCYAKPDETLENAVIQQFTNAEVAFNVLVVCSEHTLMCVCVNLCSYSTTGNISIAE